MCRYEELECVSMKDTLVQGGQQIEAYVMFLICLLKKLAGQKRDL